MPVLGRLWPIVCALLLGGCYAYTPLSTGPSPDQGTSMRLQLAAPVDFRLQRFTANDITRVSGEVIRWGDEDVALSVFGLRSQAGHEFQAVGETIVLPRSNIAAAEVRRLSTLRTAGLVGLIVLGTVATEAILTEGGGGGDGGPPIQTQ